MRNILSNKRLCRPSPARLISCESEEAWEDYVEFRAKTIEQFAGHYTEQMEGATSIRFITPSKTTRPDRPTVL